MTIGCPFCCPDEHGEFSMFCFTNPEQTSAEREARIGLYGGQITVEIGETLETPRIRLSAQINFCPMCGRRQKHAEEG